MTHIQTIVLALVTIGNLLALIRTGNLNKRLTMAERLLPGVHHSIKTVGTGGRQ